MLSNGFYLASRLLQNSNFDLLANSFDKAIIEAKIKPEDEKTETELNPDKIENEKSFWNTLWGALQGEYNENPTGTGICQ